MDEITQLSVSETSKGLRVEVTIHCEKQPEGLDLFLGTESDPRSQRVELPKRPVIEPVDTGFYSRIYLDPKSIGPEFTTLTVAADELQASAELPKSEENTGDGIETEPPNQDATDQPLPATLAERTERAPAKTAAIRATILDTQAGKAFFRVFTSANDKPDSLGLPAQVTITSLSPLEVTYADKPSDPPLTGNEVSVATGNDGAVNVLIRLTGDVRGADVFFCLSGSSKTSGPHYVRRPRTATPSVGRETS